MRKSASRKAAKIAKEKVQLNLCVSLRLCASALNFFKVRKMIMESRALGRRCSFHNPVHITKLSMMIAKTNQKFFILKHLMG
jgi:hypothetical protein